MSKSGNRQRTPKFPVGELVRVTSDKHIPPEGFRPGSGALYPIRSDDEDGAEDE